ncbi:MAG: peptide chain release factor N(5)-glutamine methyltransferase [Christensenellaceae bacterium]|jgi:release factor glutamine methyltransferase|nr:peptide chain release factor N(5)-glutamine methyltransferase [Christensenellaceae bacterium]
MKRFKFTPLGFGIVNGACVVLNGLGAYAVFNNLETKVYSVKVSRFMGGIKHVPIIRGIILFFYYIWLWFRLLDISYTHFDVSAARKSAKNRKFLEKRSRTFYIICTCLILGVFIVFPMLFNLLLSLAGVNDTQTLTIVSVFFKIACLFMLFVLLKNISVSKTLFKYNYAVNKVCNAYSYGNSLKYSKVLYASPYMALSPFNFFILSLILIYSLIPVLTFLGTGLLGVVFNIIASILIICLAYEVLFVIEYTKGRFVPMRYFSYLFVWLSWFSISKCESKHLRIAEAAMEEVVELNFDKINGLNAEDFAKDDIKFSLVYNEVKTELLNAGIDDTSETDLLIAQALNLKRSDILFLRKLRPTDYNKIRELLKRRLTRTPLDKILKRKEFFREEFYVDDFVLSPRPETEILAERVVNYVNKKKEKFNVLDMCTGSGCIAVAVAKNTSASVVGVDFSKRALAVARRNAINLGANVNFVLSDMFKDLKETKRFDIIVSNPPYVATGEIKNLDKEVREHDPIMALDGGADGLKFYRILAAEAPKFLKEYGKLFLEIGIGQAEEIVKLLTQNFKDIKVTNDYSNIPRIIEATRK